MVYRRTDSVFVHSYPTVSIRESAMNNDESNANLREVAEKDASPTLKLVEGTGKKVLGLKSKGKARTRLHLTYLFDVVNEVPEEAKNAASKHE
jgi:hypothetical protein